MEARWRAFWARSGAKGNSLPPFRDLAGRYAEPHRLYHTFAHIGLCLKEYDAVRPEARQPDAVEMAIWYHDAVYDPRAADNEERSARLALDVAESAGLAIGSRTAELIRASTHRSVPDDPDTRLFADIDLSILGQPGEVFDEYERGVRKEYAWVPEAAFRAGRSGILRSFLARPSIYGTGGFRARYENAARSNLERSLRSLTP